jgi:hypothetical protein
LHADLPDTAADDLPDRPGVYAGASDERLEDRAEEVERVDPSGTGATSRPCAPAGFLIIVVTRTG